MMQDNITEPSQDELNSLFNNNQENIPQENIQQEAIPQEVIPQEENQRQPDIDASQNELQSLFNNKDNIPVAEKKTYSERTRQTGVIPSDETKEQNTFDFTSKLKEVMSPFYALKKIKSTVNKSIYDFEEDFDNARFEDFGETVPTHVFVANKLKKGIAETLAMPAGAPIEAIWYLANEASKAIGQGEVENIGGMKAQTKAFMWLMGEDPKNINLKTKSDPLRYTGAVAEAFGGSVAPVMGLYGKINNANKYIRRGQKIGLAASESVSATLSGLGKEGGGDIVEELAGKEYRSAGEIGGSIIGAVAPYGLATTLSPVVSRILGYLDPAVQKSIGANQAALKIQNELIGLNSGEIKSKLENTKKLRLLIKGFSPSLGMSTNSLGIKTVEQELAGASQKNFDIASKAESDSIDAIAKEAKKLFPKGGLDITTVPRKILSKVKVKIKNEMSVIRANLSKLELTINTGDPVKIGEALVKEKIKLQEASRKIKNIKYDDVFDEAEKQGITIDSTQLRELADKILNSDALVFAKKSPTLKEIIDTYRTRKTVGSGVLSLDGKEIPSIIQPNSEISVREFLGLRREINRELSIASNSTNRNETFIKQLTDAKKIINKNISELRDTKLGGFNEKLIEADRYFASEYQSVFKDGVGAKLGDKTKPTKTSAENIVSEIIMKDADGLDRFKAIYGDSPEANTMLQDGILDMFSRAVIKDGVYSKTQATNFIHKYDIQLSKLPYLKDILSNKVKGHQALVNRNAVLDAKLKATKKAKLASITGNLEPTEMVLKALDNKVLSSDLAKSVYKKGGDEGLSSLRYETMTAVLKNKDPLDFFNKNYDNIKILFKGSEDHLEKIKYLSEAKSMLNNKLNINKVKTGIGETDPLKKHGTTTQEATTMTRHAYSGFLSKWHVAANLVTKKIFKIRRDEMDRLMDDALYNQDTADLLIEGLGKKNIDIEKYQFKLRNRLFSIGAKANIVIQNQDEFLED